MRVPRNPPYPTKEQIDAFWEGRDKFELDFPNPYELHVFEKGDRVIHDDGTTGIVLLSDPRMEKALVKWDDEGGARQEEWSALTKLVGPKNRDEKNYRFR